MKTKMKTKKSLALKFRVTGTGKLKRSYSGKRHLLTGKSSKRKRQLRRPGVVDEGKLKLYKTLLGV